MQKFIKCGLSQLPKGPTANRLYQTIAGIRSPIEVFEACRKKYGKTFTLRILGLPPCVVISDPADLKQIFLASSEQLHAGKLNAAFLQSTLGSFSLLILDGQKHLQHRKLLLPPFHGEHIKAYAEVMCQAAKARILQWKVGDNLSLVNEALDITFNVILKAVFGMREDNVRFKTLTVLLQSFMNILEKPISMLTLFIPLLHINLGPLTPWSKIIKLRREIDACLFQEIESRKSAGDTSQIDILSLLLQARDENGNLMTNQEIRDELITLLVAGHETTATGISWALYGILSNPDVLQKIKIELSDEIVENNSLIKNLDKLVYLDATIKEALRITPVVANVIRVTQEEYKLGEYILPKNTGIMPCVHLVHHDPQIWHEPEKFKPERFLENLVMPYTYLPFGNGIRRCIGAAFAHYEMKIIIAQILLYTELRLPENYMSKPTRRGILTVPSDGLPAIVVMKKYD